MRKMSTIIDPEFSTIIDMELGKIAQNIDELEKTRAPEQIEAAEPLYFETVGRIEKLRKLICE